MKNIPKVSVLLTSFNHEKYIGEAIESVLNQTYADFELIIWDDCSPDSSWTLIGQYSDPRIRAFRNEVNLGPIVGANKAIAELARGEYIAIHHSDDAWEPDKLEKQVAYLQAHPEVGAVFSKARVIAEDSTPLPDEQHFYVRFFDQPNRTRHEWLRYFFSQGNALCHPSVLIRKVCYQECGLYRYGMAQVPDLDMWMRLCLKYEIHILPDQLVRFRARADDANASGNRPDTRIRGVYEYYKLLPTYQMIESFAELVKVFPSAKKYDRGVESDRDFALAMVALEEKPFPFTQLFGLDLLFGIISDPQSAANIKRLYDFDYRNFIALTAQHDVFAREELVARDNIIAERDKIIAEHDKIIAARDATIDHIYASRSWRLGQPLRTIAKLFTR